MKTTIICQPYRKKFTEYPVINRICKKTLMNSAHPYCENHKEKQNSTFYCIAPAPVKHLLCHTSLLNP